MLREVQRAVDLQRAGNPVITGDLDMRNFRLLNVGAPQESNDAAILGGSSGGYAPIDSAYVVIGGPDATLTDERALVAGNGITLTDNGAGANLVVQSAWNPTAAIIAWLENPTSANLRAAMTDESGTGALLFAGGDIGAATGTSLTLSSLTAGRVLFAGTSGIIDDDSSLLWDDTNKWLGVGASATDARLYTTRDSTDTAGGSQYAARTRMGFSGSGTSITDNRFASSSRIVGSGTSAFTGAMVGVEAIAYWGASSAVNAARILGVDAKAFNGSELSIATGSSTFTRLQAGLFESVRSDASSATTLRIDGIASTARTVSPGTVTNLSALTGSLGMTNGGSGFGTVTTMTGLWIAPGNNPTGGTDLMAGGTITNFIGILLDDPTSGPTYTNAPEAIRIPSWTPTSLGIRQQSTSMTNRFAGNTRFGADTAPTVALDVTGAALISSTLGVSDDVSIAATKRLYLGGTAAGFNIRDASNVFTLATGGLNYLTISGATGLATFPFSIDLPGGSSNGYIQIGEFNGTSDAAAPSDNKARIYVRDNGAGKEQLVVRFNTGAVQVLATEP